MRNCSGHYKETLVSCKLPAAVALIFTFCNITILALNITCKPGIHSIVVLTWFVLVIPYNLFGQIEKTVPDGTDGTLLVIPYIDSTTGKAMNLPPNQINTPVSSVKIGMGYIGDYAAYALTDVFKQQMDSAGLKFTSMYKTRDFRMMFSGKFKTKRVASWRFAYMYDGNAQTWLLRETGFHIGVPELFGNVFIGRTKEGYSMVKVMNGHSPWTAERQMALDVIPILADGVKYMGYLPGKRIVLNLAYFNDVFSKGQSFSTYEWQAVARVGWLPFYDEQTNKVFHIAANYRYGRPNNGAITLKSRPESNPAPQILNTGTFAADYSDHPGIEMYYSTGRFLIGSEVMMHRFRSSKSEDHNFVGGDVVMTYFFTKGYRPYNTATGIFGFVNVNKSITKGGWGEWEGVLRYSSLDLNDGAIKGGKFWRITPMVNWYMTKVARMEFIYGYGILDRYQLLGAIHFFQARLQLTVL